MEVKLQPFSGKNFHENSASADFPCVICGKQVDRPFANVVVVDGGMSFGPADSNPDDPAYMGSFRIGRNCWSKYRRELLAAGAVEVKR